MRRIGFRHAIITPPRETVVIDVSRLEANLEATNRQIDANRAQLARLETVKQTLEQQLSAFRALPIDRDDEDPEVPQEPPPQANDRARDRARLRGGGG